MIKSQANEILIEEIKSFVVKWLSEGYTHIIAKNS